MKKYIDKSTGEVFASMLEYKEKHPHMSFPLKASAEVLDMLGLEEVTVEQKQEEPQEQSLEELKAKGLEILQEKFLDYRRNKATMMSSLGFEIDATERAIIDVGGLVVISESLPSDERIAFMDANNEVRMLNHEELLTLQREIAINGSKIYQVKWMKREQILNAESAEQLLAMDRSFEHAQEEFDAVQK